MQGCVLSIADNDALVLKHQAISIQSWPKTHSIGPVLNKYIAFIVNNISK